MVLMNVDVGCRYLQRSRVLSRDSGNVLRGKMCEEMCVISPFGNGAVALQAAMSNHRTTVHTFADYVRFFECLVRLAFLGFTLFAERT